MESWVKAAFGLGLRLRHLKLRAIDLISLVLVLPFAVVDEYAIVNSIVGTQRFFDVFVLVDF